MPTLPATCICTQAVVDQHGEPVQGAKVTVSLVNVPTFAADAMVHVEGQPSYTDASGGASIQLVREVEYTIQVTHQNRTRSYDITVDDAASMTLKPVIV